MLKKILIPMALLAIAGCRCTDCCDDCTPDADRASLKKAYTVIVGVENGYAGKCAGAKKDTSTIKGVLSQYSKKCTVLTDKKATIKAVCAALQEAVKQDLCIFYFSGHGGSIPTAQTVNDKTEVDKKDEYICLYDGGMLDNSIWNIISKSKGRVIMIFDCCHSQTMFREPITFKRQMERASQHISGDLRMVCWSGCPDDSYSYGDSSGGELTKSIKRLFKKSLTYDQLWSKIEADSRLKKYEKVQRTTMGTKFGSTKVFQ